MIEEITVTTFRSRKTKKGSAKTTTRDEFARRLEKPKVTDESVADFQAMAKSMRDDVKDVGGFVNAVFINDERSNANLKFCYAITLDVDHAYPGFEDTFDFLFDYDCIIYSTHSHTPEQPRLRIIIFITRAVTPVEYEAVARLLAQEMGMEYFDPTTFQPERLMYWPSHPKDAEYVFKNIAGTPVDPDAYLAKLGDWQDRASWPAPASETLEAKQKRATELQDPLTKDGVVGAVNRVYHPIDTAIGKFLSHIYHPSDGYNNRYDYVPAESGAGLVISDDRKTAYSHHASDPARGHQRSAFDLVRVHKFNFGGDEQKSFKAMCDFAMQDEAVAKLLQEEKHAQALADFAPAADWEKRLRRNKMGLICNLIVNVSIILWHHPKLQGIRYNKLAHQIYTQDLPWDRDEHPAWSDTDTTALEEFLGHNYTQFSIHNVESALANVAQRRAYHPVREYLDGLPAWDQTPRVESLFIEYLGADDSDYVRAVSRKTLVAAVARVMNPGVKFDSIPVLNGGQGIGKSTLIARLGRDWFSDSLSIADMKDKTAAEKLQGNWILELSEMAGIKKMDVETVKSFASRRDDQFRPAYGRVVKTHERQCIIIGTTNNDGGFLRDVTGNRRFWPIPVPGGATKRPWDLTDDDINQIWAEALVLYKAGEQLYLTGAIAQAAMEHQREALEVDDREGIVAAYLEMLLPEGWEKMKIHERIDYLRDPEAPTSPIGVNKRTQVCNLEIWCECFENNGHSIQKHNSYEIQAILKSIGGWKRLESKSGKRRCGPYGVQYVYVRDEAE